MTDILPTEPSLHHLLDILGAPPGNLPGRADGFWPEIFELARRQSILHWLAMRSLSDWGSSIPPDLGEMLRFTLERNRARNIFLSRQIAELARLFRGAGIPMVSLKGAACIVRKVYPEGSRFLSDIDVLVPSGRIGDARALLRSVGYEPEWSGRELHHIEHLIHPARAGGVEVHTHPFSLGVEDHFATERIFTDSDAVALHGEEVRVPSITDHFWILLMTDLVGRSFLPHLGNALEASLFQLRELEPDRDELARRAAPWGIPNAFPGLFHARGKYFGRIGCSMEGKTGFERWEQYSIRYQRIILKNIGPQVYRKRYIALTFLPGGSIPARLRLAARLVLNEIRYDLANTPGQRWKIPGIVLKRMAGDAFGYFACARNSSGK